MPNSRNLVLQLLSDELSDTKRRRFESVDQVVGTIVYDLIQLASSPSDPAGDLNSEVILDRLVRVAASAACGAADLGLSATEEDDR